MTRALVPLSMATISLLPEQCRSCVKWELPANDQVSIDGQAAFEKEVWLSGVMLTWGSAGHIATVDGRTAGFALFAPATAVPAAATFPTAPVSPDAVLLTAARVLDGFTGQGIGRYLMNGVVAALTKRGVRAIELFGRTANDDAEVNAGSDETSPAAGSCTVPAEFAEAVGFKVVAPHHRFPRLRYDLHGEFGWKAEVEAALERLFEVVSVPTAPAAPVAAAAI